MKESIDHLSTILDFRMAWKIKCTIPEIFLLTQLAVLGNSETWEDIEDFGENYLDESRILHPYEHGIPSHDRIRTFWECST